MVLLGCGQNEVTLEEKAVTIMQFKEIISSQKFQVIESKGLSPFDQVLALLRFLDKYDCDHAIEHLVEMVEKKVQVNWPPLLLFLCGAYLDRSELCKRALDAPVHSWSVYIASMQPPGLQELGRYGLHPRWMPYRLLQTIPLDYAMALGSVVTTDSVETVIRSAGMRNVYGSKFMREFLSLREAAAFSQKTDTATVA